MTKPRPQENIRVRTSYPFFIFVSLLTIASPGYSGQWTFNREITNAYHDLLKLEHEQARKSLNQVLENDPLNYAAWYTLNFSNVLELMVTEDKSLFKSYQKTGDQILKKITDSKDVTPFKDFFRAEINLQWAFIHLKFGEEFTAAWLLRKAYKQINSNIKNYPSFIPNNKTIGFLHVMIGSIPDKYNWVLNLFGLKGEVSEGITEIEIVAQSTDFMNLEAQILGSLIQSFILQNYEKSITRIQSLLNQHMDYILIRYILAIIQMKASDSDAALQTLGDHDSLIKNQLDFTFIHYLKGEIYLQRGSYQASQNHLKSFLRKFKGENFIKDAYYRLSLSYWLSNELDSATKYLELGKISGNARTEADKYAARQLKSDPFTHKGLTRARLFTDGGYYEQAKTELMKIEYGLLQTGKEQAEFDYRWARLSHKQTHYQEALEYYKKVLLFEGKGNWYFLPNAALQAGHIYQLLGDNANALSYYQKALSFQDYEYENSIRNKARSAIESLKIE